jgi:hypothetical protein
LKEPLYSIEFNGAQFGEQAERIRIHRRVNDKRW